MAEPPAPNMSQLVSSPPPPPSKPKIDPPVMTDQEVIITMNHNNTEEYNDIPMNYGNSHNNNTTISSNTMGSTNDMMDSMDSHDINTTTTTTTTTVDHHTGTGVDRPSEVVTTTIANAPVTPPPYIWDTTPERQPSSDILHLWTEVGNGIDKNQNVVWKSAVESFDQALQYLEVCVEARIFIERYGGAVVGILAEQSPTKIGPHERSCVHDTLSTGCLIVAADLNIQLHRGCRTIPQSSSTTRDPTTTSTNIIPTPPTTVLDTSSSSTTTPFVVGECILLDTILSHIFSKKKNFYRGPKGNTSNNHTWQQQQQQHPSNNNIHHHNNNPIHPHPSSGGGYPEIRIRNIEKFRACNGFQLLHSYLLARIALLPSIISSSTTTSSSSNNMTTLTTATNTAAIVPNITTTTTGTGSSSINHGFPSFETIHHILTALYDTIPTNTISSSTSNMNEAIAMQIQIQQQQQEMDAIQISEVIMKYVSVLSDDALKKIPTDLLSLTFKSLQRIFDRLICTRRHSCMNFYHFYRTMILSMISSPSLPLKLTGWEQMNELIKAATDHRPPPRSYRVTNAGCTFVNGTYHFAGTLTPDKYVKPGTDISYIRTIPLDAMDGAGKKLTLFRCTMRSQQKWWFLSEADEEQPGTDRDIDYYQHKSKEHEEAYPPPSGWIACRNAGMNPPPNLQSFGVMVPPGQEMETLEHQLAKWAIENEIVEMVLGDTTIHREVVSRSTVLIKFLASMCTRDDTIMIQPSKQNESVISTAMNNKQPNMYCLQPSHLLFAWKTCTRKADAAVSLQVYHLLVSILPLCPSTLAIPLLQAIQTSLQESSEKRDYLYEVSEFCSALAALNLVDANTKNQATTIPGTSLTEDVREEVLNLLWSVLTHPGVSSLKSYDSLKRYVTRELKIEPKGTELRERFLRSCIVELSTNAEKKIGSTIDEDQALRMVNLTLFILEACPRSQADAIVATNHGELPSLLYKELVAYLERRRDKSTIRPRGVIRKPSIQPAIGPTTSFSNNGPDATQKLDDRLRMLRHVYGLSDPTTVGISDPILMSASMLNTLWELCLDTPAERELLMVFIASGSNPGRVAQYEHFGNASVGAPTGNVVSPGGTPIEPLLSAVFSADVCQSVFLDLFCSHSFDYDQLGPEGYRSFQFLFKGLRASTCHQNSKKIALDAMWRICLLTNNDTVAIQSMHDLLGVYIGLNAASRGVGNGQMVEPDENFGDRIFQCLDRVKTDFESGLTIAERSMERCMRILNAAIGQTESEGLTTTPTLARLTALCKTDFSLDDAMRCLPHGMRAQSCCRRIGIQARRHQNQNNANYENPSPRNQQSYKFWLDVHPLETLATVKYKVALNCQCALSLIRPININGRARGSTTEASSMNLGVVPEDTVMDELGVVQGCEIVFLITERVNQPNGPNPPVVTQRSLYSNDLSAVFFNRDGNFANQLFSILLSILEALPWKDSETMSMDNNTHSRFAEIHTLVWDLLLAMPTNENVSRLVRSLTNRKSDPPVVSTSESMEVETLGEPWTQLLDTRTFDRSVYVLKTIDAFLQPAPEVLSILQAEKRLALEKMMIDEANKFRRSFIDADGFVAVARFFSTSGKAKEVKTRQGNAVALRILKSCLFGNVKESQEAVDPSSNMPDKAGLKLLRSLSDTSGLLKSLTAMVVEDSGISSSTILDVCRFLRLLFQSPQAAESFVELTDAKSFLGVLLMWDETPIPGKISLSVNSALQVRKGAHDLILETPALADNALPWLIHAIESVDVESESTSEYFDVLEHLISGNAAIARSKSTTDMELRSLAVIVCKKLAACPRPGSETDLNDVSTGVLSGCLKLLRALVEYGGGNVLKTGVNILITSLETERWSDIGKNQNRSVLSMMSTPFENRTSIDDAVLVDLMGVIFDGFLSPGGLSSVAICCEKESRARGFDVVGAAARKCTSADGYLSLARRINILVSTAAPKLRHRWGQFGSNNDHHSRSRSSKFAGLRNQGCTCYMNSVLQQFFMMPELRKTLCDAPLPSSLRSVGGNITSNGRDLVGKKISLQWDSGVSFDAMVESFDDATDMHTIRYCPIEIAVGAAGRQQINPNDVARLPPCLPDEFVLSEGRPGKETGVFDIIPDAADMDSSEAKSSGNHSSSDVKESEDEAMSRHLLEEVQRTFIHLEEGSRGQCFDPRALVEACAFLKLEFDVWQQNDASEFATKLLDRLEISLKKWAPETFHSLDHTFGLKQTKQKTCKKCGLKTNREEKLLTIDCQIRGKSDIQEALSAMTEVEIMEGSNQVYCDRCKENTDTILKSAISTFPNMLILSLKRFDLDYNTFETVKLNSRCAFGQTLNMKKYSLDAVEVLELAEQETSPDGEKENDPNIMDTEELHYDDCGDPLSGLPDEKYEYRLAGVLVHAGVAQGGHYYSFIKDRISGPDEKWYRFDDDDVTPFDPSLIETECFGGKVKKETKWPNGQVHTVEQEQFANALMVFYEKVMPNDIPPIDSENHNAMTSVPPDAVANRSVLTGYEVFEPDVRRSNEIHRWQAFLFDTEFRGFLKGLLRYCNLPKNKQSSESNDSWRPPVLHMLLSYVFDVMMYSSDYSNLNEWSRILEEILLGHPDIATIFVQNLAKRSSQISANWLRTYLLDCPDHSFRAASLRIFMAAIRSCSNSDDETKALNVWIKAWREQLSELHSSSSDSQVIVPCSLKGKFSLFEEPEKIGGVASSLGIIISFTNIMLDIVPRYWRFSSELCLFVRFLASMTNKYGETLLRRPMIDAQIPARIIALIARDRTSSSLKAAFPGASVSTDVATTQMRPESNPNTHIMHMNGNSVLNSSDLNRPQGPNHSDYVVLLEALSCLAGIQGTLHEPLVIRENDDIVGSRPWFSLTDEAAKALTSIFHENCAQGAPGMGQREIEIYLHRSGMETGGGISSQKIVDMFSKYPTTTGIENDRATYLTLEGFLAYYRDCVQSNDLRLRVDLHTFGFRPNLTRRSRESRYFMIGDRESQCLPAQSVALDVAEMLKDKPVQLGLFADYGLAHTPCLYSVAHEVCEPLMEYLVAAATYRKNSDSLIDRTLVSIYLSSNDWEGNKTVAGATSMLEVIAATPGDDQQARINRIMLSNVKAQRTIEFGSGILDVLRALHHMRQSQHYRNEVHWSFSRYIRLLKDLYSLYPIFKWMSENRGQWSFIEREFESARTGSVPSNHIRSDFVPRDSEPIISSLDHHTNSDSEMGGMQDSEEDDEDSNFDNGDVGLVVGSDPTQISVQGAGNPAVNGLYVHDGFFESALRYSREGIWNNSQYKFYIFLCNVSNSSKHWYISIVPKGSNPGTNSDIDFYTAKITESSIKVPPQRGWTKAVEGKDPPPEITYIRDNVANELVRTGIGSGIVVDDEIDDDSQENMQSRSHV